MCKGSSDVVQYLCNTVVQLLTVVFLKLLFVLSPKVNKLDVDGTDGVLPEAHSDLSLSLNSSLTGDQQRALRGHSSIFVVASLAFHFNLQE